MGLVKRKTLRRANPKREPGRPCRGSASGTPVNLIWAEKIRRPWLGARRVQPHSGQMRPVLLPTPDRFLVRAGHRAVTGVSPRAAGRLRRIHCSGARVPAVQQEALGDSEWYRSFQREMVVHSGVGVTLRQSVRAQIAVLSFHFLLPIGDLSDGPGIEASDLGSR